MHPLLPELVEQDLSKTNERVFNLYRTFADISAGQQGAEYSYKWQKPGEDKSLLFDKISYIKAFEPWQWILGTGVYILDLDKQYYQRLYYDLTLAGILFLFLLGINLFIGNSVTGPLLAFKDHIRQLIDQETDFKMKFKDDKSEIGEMARSIEEFRINLRQRMIHEQHIQEQKRKELEEALRVKTEFLANMSHEIRTPLNGIIATASLLEQELKDKKQKQYLDVILDSGQHLMVVINDILDLSKIQAGKMSLQLEVFEINTLIQNIQALFKVQLKQKNLSFDFKSLPQNTFYKGDEIRISQILTNLISNAIKFTQKGGITLTVDIQDHPHNDKLQNVTISIADTGAGIAEDDIDSLFERYSQFDSTKEEATAGTGLGLSICERLVKLMQGDISVESELGKGTTFFITLPLEKSDQKQHMAHEEDRKKISNPLNGRKALLAEDVATNQFIIGDILQRMGADLDIASNGQEAVTMNAEKNYDIILMDIQMPVMNGIDAAIEIRKIDKDTPIFAMTAHVMEEQKDECFNAGMNGFVTKPIQINELNSALGEYFQKKK